MGTFAITFGNIEYNTRAGAIKLVARGEARRKAFNYRTGPNDKAKRLLVSPKFFVIELGQHRENE